MNETIRGLIATTINHLVNAGYSETIVETYQAVYNGLVRFCETDGVKAYTTEVGECFWKHFQKENPNMSRDRVSAYRTGIKHLDCVFLGSEFKKVLSDGFHCHMKIRALTAYGIHINAISTNQENRPRIYAVEFYVYRVF